MSDEMSKAAAKKALGGLAGALVAFGLAGWALSYLSGLAGYPVTWWTSLLTVWLVRYLLGGKKS